MNAKMKITSLLLAAVLTISLPVQALAAALPSDGLSEAVAPVTTVSPDGNGVSETVAEAYVTAAAPDTSVSPDAPAAVPTDAVSLDAPDDVVPVPDDTATSDVPDNVSDNFYAVHDEVTDIIDISTPVADDFSTLSEGEGKSVTNMFNFSLDPFGLVEQTGASRYDGVSHANTGVLFTNLTDVGAGDNVKYMSNRSDYLKLSNETTKPMYLTLRMEVIGLDSAGILMNGQPQYSSAQKKWIADMDDADPRLKFEVISNGDTELEHGLPVESTTSTGYVFWEYTYYLAAADVVANDANPIATDRTGKINARDAYDATVTEAEYETQWNPETYEDEEVLVTPASITSDCSSIAFQLVGTINTNNADWSDVSDLSGASLKVSWKAWDVESDPEDTNPYENVEVKTLSINDESTTFTNPFSELFSSKTVEITWADDDAKQLVGNLILQHGIALTIKADGTLGEEAQFGTVDNDYDFTVSGTTVTIKKAEDDSTLATIVFPIKTGERTESDLGTVKFTNAASAEPGEEPGGLSLEDGVDIAIANSTEFFTDSGENVTLSIGDLFGVKASIEWVSGLDSTLKQAVADVLLSTGATLTIDKDGKVTNANSMGDYSLEPTDNTFTIKSDDTVCAVVTLAIDVDKAFEEAGEDSRKPNYPSVSGTLKLGGTVTQPVEPPEEEQPTTTPLTIKNGTTDFEDANEMPVGATDVFSSALIAWTNSATANIKFEVNVALLLSGIELDVAADGTITINNPTISGYDLTSTEANKVTIKSGSTEYATITFELKDWSGDGVTGPVSGTVKFGTDPQPITVNDASSSLPDLESYGVDNVSDYITGASIVWSSDANSTIQAGINGVLLNTGIGVSIAYDALTSVTMTDDTYSATKASDTMIIIASSGTSYAAIILTFDEELGLVSTSGTLKFGESPKESIMLNVDSRSTFGAEYDEGTGEYALDADPDIVVNTVELEWANNATDDEQAIVKTALATSSDITISSASVITYFSNDEFDGMSWSTARNGNTITIKNDDNKTVATLKITFKSALADWFDESQNELGYPADSISGSLKLTVPAGRNNAPARNVFALAAPAMNMTALPSMSVDAPDDDEPIDNTVADVNPDVPDTDEAPDTPVEAVESTPDEIGETVMESDTPSDTMDNVTNAVSDVNDEDSDDVQTVEEVTSENPTEATAPDEDSDDDDANLTDADDADDDDDAVSDDTDATFDTADDVSNDDDATSNSTDAVSDTDATSNSTDAVSDTDATSNTTDATSDDE